MICEECHTSHKFTTCPLCRAEIELDNDTSKKSKYKTADSYYIMQIKDIISKDNIDNMQHDVNIGSRKKYFQQRFYKTTFNNNFNIIYYNLQKSINKNKTRITRDIDKITYDITPKDMQYKNNLIKHRFRQYDNLIERLEKYAIEDDVKIFTDIEYNELIIKLDIEKKERQKRYELNPTDD